jgi:hypothetical protein
MFMTEVAITATICIRLGPSPPVGLFEVVHEELLLAIDVIHMATTHNTTARWP